MKGSSEVRQRIIKAAKEARENKDYPIELQHDCHYISDKYNDHSNKILPPNHPPYSSLERKYYTTNETIFFTLVVIIFYSTSLQAKL